MKKILCIAAVFTSLLGHASWGSTRSPVYKKEAEKRMIDRLKLASTVGIGFLWLSKHRGGIVEYELSKVLGVRTGITQEEVTYSVDAEPSQETGIVVKRSGVALPITLQLYPGKDRQFCWIVGLQPHYTTSLKVKKYDTKKKGDFFKTALSENFDKTSEEVIDDEKFSRWGLSLVTGIQYEFGVGLTLGFLSGRNLLNQHREHMKIDTKKELTLDWFSQVTIGYNFASPFYTKAS